jgi:hypothetical protein
MSTNVRDDNEPAIKLLKNTTFIKKVHVLNILCTGRVAKA